MIPEYARRWHHKRTTDCDDLAGALWMMTHNGYDLERTDDLLWSIRPESGWRQEVNFNPNKPTLRDRPYGPHWQDITGEGQ